MWKGIVGRSFTPNQFDDYVHTLSWPAWRPAFIVLHNTGAPTLAQRPHGLTLAHIHALEAFYRDRQRWSAGPHLFIDDRQIWAFTPLTTPGVHSPSWNRLALGFEMLGDFETEDFATGRGAAVRRNAVEAMASVSGILGLDPHSMKLHREDPLTTHACPGAHVGKLDIIQDVTDAITERHAGDHPIRPPGQVAAISAAFA